MFMRTGVVRKVAGLITLVVLLAWYARVVEAQESPAQEYGDCISGAWGEYEGCLEDLPWWAELLCAARFSADVILCLPKEALKAV